MMEKSGMEPAAAKAEAIAGQIVAEMLGMVCHRDYFLAYEDQTVQPLIHCFVADVIGNCCALQWLSRFSLLGHISK